MQDKFFGDMTAIVALLASDGRLTAAQADALYAEIGKQQADTRALLRRDWAVRVLDAWADQGVDPFATSRYGGKWYCESAYQNRRYVAKDPDAARHAAALAVFPTLSADVRTELGECP